MIAATIHRSVANCPALSGTAVVIDVFRASNTVISVLAAGAGEVVLVADLERARELKARHPGWLLLGERGGLMPAGFDGNNSPAAAPTLVCPGQTVVLTTSAGTQAMTRVGAAARVAVASFANASAVAAWIRSGGSGPVTLLAAGLEGRVAATEDDLCARFIAALLAGEQPDFARTRRALLHSAGAARLRRLGQDDDLAHCLARDVTTVVPVVTVGDLARATAARPGC